MNRLTDKKYSLMLVFILSFFIFGFFLIINNINVKVDHRLGEYNKFTGYIALFTGGIGNLDFNYFHIEEFIENNFQYFNNISLEDVMICQEFFEKAYCITKTDIEKILSQGEITDIYPAFIFSTNVKVSQKQIEFINERRMNMSLAPLKDESLIIGYDVVAYDSRLDDIFILYDDVDGRLLQEYDIGNIIMNKFVEKNYGYKIGDNISVNLYFWKEFIYKIVGKLSDPFPELPGRGPLLLMNKNNLFGELNVSLNDERYNFLYIRLENPDKKNEVINNLKTIYQDAYISYRGSLTEKNYSLLKSIGSNIVTLKYVILILYIITIYFIIDYYNLNIINLRNTMIVSILSIINVVLGYALYYLTNNMIIEFLFSEKVYILFSHMLSLYISLYEPGIAVSLFYLIFYIRAVALHLRQP